MNIKNWKNEGWTNKMVMQELKRNLGCTYEK